MRLYMQLANLFHQCAISLLSRDGRIADCTVRHPGVERPFSRDYNLYLGFPRGSYLCYFVRYDAIVSLNKVCSVANPGTES